MNDDGARIELRAGPDDRTAVVVVEGEIDLGNAARLEEALERAAGADAGRTVVVDLSATEYIDSSGFRMLHRAAARGTVALVVPDGSRVARAVAVAGMHALMPLHPSVEATLPEP